MKVSFADQARQRLQDDLSASQVCGETAGKLYADAKGAMQQAAAALVGEGEATPDEAEHTARRLRALRKAARGAAEGFSSALAGIDRLVQQLESAAAKPRRRGSPS